MSKTELQKVANMDRTLTCIHVYVNVRIHVSEYYTELSIFIPSNVVLYVLSLSKSAALFQVINRRNALLLIEYPIRFLFGANWTKYRFQFTLQIFEYSQKGCTSAIKLLTNYVSLRDIIVNKEFINSLLTIIN